MKKVFILCLICFLHDQGHAQESGRIQGKLQSTETTFHQYALLLKNTSDSSLVKAELSREDQQFLFEAISFGSYFIEIRSLQQILLQTAPFSLNQSTLTLPDIQVPKATTLLQEQKITQSKPVVERKADKLIYNVENTLESPANDALAVLQKAPGLSVDQNGQISMRGKRGVMVMINGKMTYLSGAQLSNLLRTTTAGQIARIEVISNPSSKYDAEGNAGIVNIVLKKDQKRGTNGMVVLSYGRGQYGKSSNGININARGAKLNVFSSLNVFNNVGFNDLRLYRQFYQQGQLSGAYRQSNYLLFPSSNQIYKLGLDYTLSKKSSLSLITQGALTQFNPRGDNIAFVENSQGMDESYYTSINRTREKYFNYSINANTKTTLDSSGTELSTDWDYARYGQKGIQQFVTRYYNLNHEEIQAVNLLRGDVLGRLNIFAAKVDLLKPLGKNRKLEAGLKSSLVRNDNNMAYFDKSSGKPVFDLSQSNHFVYSENINALYATFSKEYQKTAVQIGLRAEQTIAKGEQKLNGQSFHRNYWQLFPTFFMSHPFNKNHELALSLSRRIQRPGYELMNPVRLFIDATTYKVGNPYLVPQNSYIAEINHTFRQKWFSTLSATWINKSITEVLIPDEQQSNITIQTNKNLNKQYIISFSESVNLKPFKWWTMNYETTIYYSRYMGVLANMDINSGTTSFNAKMVHMLQLPQAFSLQADAYLQYREVYSFTSIKPFGACNLSLQKVFNQKRTTLKLSANDIFFTSRFSGQSTYPNYNERYDVQRDSRTIILALTHRYGKNTVPGAKRRGGGAEDEKQRAGKNV